MNIIFTEPIYKDYIWGGKKLKSKLNKNTLYEKTAESWEISTNRNGISKIKNAEYREKTLICKTKWNRQWKNRNVVCNRM